MIRRKGRRANMRSLRESLPSQGSHSDTLIFDRNNFDINKANTKIVRIFKKEGKDLEKYKETVSVLLESVETIGNEPLVNLFIELVRGFSEIEIKNNDNIEINLCTCGVSFESFCYVKDGYGECPECQSIIYTDHNEIKEPSTTLDDITKCFLNEFDVYCGNKMIDFNIFRLFDGLDVYMENHNYPTHDQSNEMEKKLNGRIDNTSLPYIRDALCSMGYKDYTKYAMIIAHHYWEWEYPDVYNLKEKLQLFYRKIQITYKYIPIEVKQRSSNLPNQYILYKLLHLCGYDCDINDFSFSKNIKTLKKLDNIYEMVCNQVNEDRIVFYRSIL